MKPEKSSESDLHPTICQLTLPRGAVACDYLPACTPQNREDQQETCVHSSPVRSPSAPSPTRPSIHLNLPFHPAEAPLSKGGWIKAFRKTLQSDYPSCMSLYISCFCRSLSARQIVCHNRSFSLYSSFDKIQLQAGRPSFIIILAAFFHTRFKSGSKFPLRHHLWLINKPGLRSFSS